MICEHINFTADVRVGRITDGDGGEVTHFTADVSLKCADCGESFGFRGLPYGYTPGHPTVSIDHLEARLWLLSPTQLRLAGMGLS